MSIYTRISISKDARRVEVAYKTLVCVFVVLTVVLFTVFVVQKYHRQKSRARQRQNFTTALRLSKSGEYADALSSYNRILEEDPDNIDALNNMGVLHLSRGDSGKALQCFKKALKPQTNVEKSHFNLGMLYMCRGEHVRAIEHYKSAARLNHHYLRPHIMMAAIYEYRGEKENAIREYEEIFKIGKKGQEELLSNSKLKKLEYRNLKRTFEVRNLLCEGFINERREEYDKALKCYGDALEMEPHFLPALIRRGITLFSLGEYSGAEREIRKALDIDPELQEVEVSLADLYFMSERQEQACELFHNLCETYDRSIILKDYLGGILLRTGQYKAAGEAFEEIVKLDADYARAHGGLGTAYLHLGDDGKAEEELRRAVELSPCDPGNYYNLACVYSKRGDTKKAIEWLSKAMKRGFNDTEHMKNDPGLENLRTAGLLAKIGL